MKFNISSTDLLKGLTNVAKAIPAKTGLPILENFLFVIKDGKLEITASDSELTLRTRVELVSAEEDGSIAVPARHILDLLKELPDQPISIQTIGESSFECKWATGKSVLPFFPAEDYPAIKSVTEDAITVTVPAETLIEGITKTVYATGDDEIRPIMNGIFFDIDVESTTLVASDSHKLICYTTSEVKAPEKASFVIHKKPANVLRSLMTKDNGEVSISFDANSVVFEFGETTMICRLIVGRYPRYRDAIPQNNSNILKIDRLRLLSTIRRVSVCANKASNHVKLNLKQGQIEVSAQDLGFAIAAVEKLDCEYNGADLSIGFKSSFFIEILNNMTCTDLVIKFGNERIAALILPAADEEEKVCGILMPIKIS